MITHDDTRIMADIYCQNYQEWPCTTKQAQNYTRATKEVHCLVVAFECRVIIHVANLNIHK